MPSLYNSDSLGSGPLVSHSGVRGLLQLHYRLVSITVNGIPRSDGTGHCKLVPCRSKLLSIKLALCRPATSTCEHVVQQLGRSVEFSVFADRQHNGNSIVKVISISLMTAKLHI